MHDSTHISQQWRPRHTYHCQPKEIRQANLWVAKRVGSWSWCLLGGVAHERWRFQFADIDEFLWANLNVFVRPYMVPMLHQKDNHLEVMERYQLRMSWLTSPRFWAGPLHGVPWLGYRFLVFSLPATTS
jgi:hypothetical protein